MLHPGGVDSRALAAIVDRFTDEYQVFTPDQRGHGRTPDSPGPITFELMAGDTISFIEREIGQPVYASCTRKGPTITAAQLGTIRCSTLVLIGDDDDMFLEHILMLYRALPSGELAVVPHASHGALVEKPDLCRKLIMDFLSNDKPATLAPIRRKTSA